MKMKGRMQTGRRRSRSSTIPKRAGQRSWSGVRRSLLILILLSLQLFPTTTRTVVAAFSAFGPFLKRRVKSISPSSSAASDWRRRRDSLLLELHEKKNWDQIIAEEEESEFAATEGSALSSSSTWKSQIPFDMKYNQRNCERAQKTFQAIRGSGPSAPVADLYGCDTSSAARQKNGAADDSNEALFWFLGKVAHVSDVSLEECVARQWPLIQQHAANLRPLDLFPAYTNDCLEIWSAPADSELDVAYNRPSVTFRKMSHDVPGAEKVKSNLVGFQGEVYEGGEEGFRTWRNVMDGKPSRPEITGTSVAEDELAEVSAAEGSASKNLDRPPTDEEMQRLEEMLQGKDINELYEEQERRRRAQEEQ